MDKPQYIMTLCKSDNIIEVKSLPFKHYKPQFSYHIYYDVHNNPTKYDHMDLYSYDSRNQSFFNELLGPLR